MIDEEDTRIHHDALRVAGHSDVFQGSGTSCHRAQLGRWSLYPAVAWDGIVGSDGTAVRESSAADLAGTFPIEPWLTQTKGRL